MKRTTSENALHLFNASHLRWIVDRLHVSVSDYAVARDFARRTRSWDGMHVWTPGGALIAARRARLSEIRLAVAYNHENQRLYRDVITGRIGRGGSK